MEPISLYILNPEPCMINYYPTPPLQCNLESAPYCGAEIDGR